MTKVQTASGWVYAVIVLDWYTKKVVGHYTGMQARSRHWLLALDVAVNRQFPDGVRGHDLHLMLDNGTQPTSLGYRSLSQVEETYKLSRKTLLKIV